MNNTIICIGRQYGSGGREIGEKLAENLGLVCYDKLLLQHTAQESGLALTAIEDNDEKPIGFGSMVSGNPFADSAVMVQTFYSEQQRVFEAERSTILSIAEKGPCVMIGRCASSILRMSGKDVLSVFIYADEEDRIHRIMRRNELDEKSAVRKLQKVDRMRRKYFDFYSDTPWGDPASYDVMISSSRFGIDRTVEMIESVLKEK